MSGASPRGFGVNSEPLRERVRDGGSTGARRAHPGVLRSLTAAVAIGVLGLAGCQAVAPALAMLGIAFGQDVLASASVNYSPRYAVELEQLLVAMAREMTGMQFQAQLAAAGYSPPPPRYAQGQPGYGQAPYPQSPYGQAPYGQSPYGAPPDPGQGVPDPNQPYPSPYDPAAQGVPPGTYGDPNANPYGQASASVPPDPNQTAAASGQPVYGDPAYGQPAPAQSPYAPQPVYGQPAPGQVAPANPYGYQTRSIEPIVVSVDLLVARAGAGAGTPLEVIEDGAVLRDGRGDPARGDKIKIRFSVNCACHVYVIGIDATGYVARIFPDPDLPFGNPVEPGREYLLPGEGEWWGLDDYRGVEQVHVLAGYVPRPEIEQLLDTLAAQPRRPPPDFRSVSEVAELPPTRGLVKVKDSPQVATTTTAGRVAFTPTSFLGRADEVGVVVTRHFVHE
jgi:hypothetical protein